jgi:hypothetical protein
VKEREKKKWLKNSALVELRENKEEIKTIKMDSKSN